MLSDLVEEGKKKGISKTDTINEILEHGCKRMLKGGDTLEFILAEIEKIDGNAMKSLNAEDINRKITSITNNISTITTQITGLKTSLEKITNLYVALATKK
jgi:hypothetical protein